MKRIMCQAVNKQSYTFGWDLPSDIFCFLAEVHVEVDAIKT